MNDKINLELTRKEFVILVSRFENSLEKDAARGNDVPDEEIALLQKLTNMKG